MSLTKMQCVRSILATISLVALLPGMSALAVEPLKTGKQVYDSVCAECHGPSEVKAPKKGDALAWAPLIVEGQHVVTARAWVGVGAMPPHGGEPTLTLEEFGRAVAFMARAAGATWQDPHRNTEMMARIRVEEAERRRALKAD